MRSNRRGNGNRKKESDSVLVRETLLRESVRTCMCDIKRYMREIKRREQPQHLRRGLKIDPTDGILDLDREEQNQKLNTEFNQQKN